MAKEDKAAKVVEDKEDKEAKAVKEAKVVKEALEDKEVTCPKEVVVIDEDKKEMFAYQSFHLRSDPNLEKILDLLYKILF